MSTTDIRAEDEHVNEEWRAMTGVDLRTLGVIPCRRCQDTGLARDGAGMDFCDCPVGNATHQAALDRALGAMSS